MKAFTNEYFSRRNQDHIYPSEFITCIRSHIENNIIGGEEIPNGLSPIVKFEEQIDRNVVGYYNWLIKNTLNVQTIGRTIKELHLFIDFFIDYGYFIEPTITIGTIELLKIIQVGIRDCHSDVMIFMIDWFFSLKIYASQSPDYMKIIVSNICEMMMFYKYHTGLFGVYPELGYLRSNMYDILYQLITTSHFEVDDFFGYIIANKNKCDEREIIEFLFHMNEPFNRRLRNHVMLYYFAQAWRKKSIHNIIHNLRQHILYNGDYQLYHNISVMLLGMKKMPVLWQMKKKQRYISQKIKVLRELKSLPENGGFPGGEDYRTAVAAGFGGRARGP
jgi:hypothetical protein